MMSKRVKILVYEARLKHGDIKYEWLSAKTGISVTTLWRIENGKKEPTISELLLIAEALGVDYTELFTIVKD